MLGRLQNLFGVKQNLPSPLPPKERVWMVGDLHGRSDLLSLFLTHVAQDIAAHGPATLVVLGDMVDRGPQSAQVLTRLHHMQKSEAILDKIEGLSLIAISGNHERMMIDFLANPVQCGRRWLRYGGMDTLRSFGVPLPSYPYEATPTELRHTCEHLSAALPAGMENWLTNLPASWGSGGLICVHAALDPMQPLRNQKRDVMEWGHPQFPAQSRTDGFLVAHGHNIVLNPVIGTTHLALDTGAWRTGRLTAALATPDGLIEIHETRL